MPQHSYIFALVLVSIALGCAASTSAQPTDVRSLERDAAAGPVMLDSAAVAPLFSEGAPAEAAAQLARSEARAAVSALQSWLEANEAHEHASAARFLYGYGLYEAERYEEALPALERSAAELHILADHSNWFAARAAFELERWEEVIRFALAVPEDSIYAPRSTFLRGRAMRRANQSHEAVRVLQTFVNAYPSAWYIAKAELELARAMVDIGDLEGAAEWLSRVSVRYPGSDEEEAAERELRRVLDDLPDEVAERYGRMSDDDLVARATALFGRHRSQQVIDLLEDELERLDPSTPLGCQAAWLVGKSYSKMRQHADAVPHYQAIIASSCSDVDTRVRALYTAGRSLWNVERDAEAVDHFTRLYNDYATHTYADDAMLYVARIHRSNGDEVAALSILEEQIRRFPEGDMLGDANWLLFEHEFGAGNYDTAAAFAEALGPRTGETGLNNRGRLAYFRARALELDGFAAQAATAFGAVVRDYPMTYYGLLAANRVAALDAAMSAELLAELRAGGASEAATEGVRVEPGEVADSLPFQRGLLLLRLGLLDLAQSQFNKLTAAYPHQESVLWLVTWLFDRVGAYHLSHDIPRRQIETFMASYPTSESLEHWHLAYPTPFNDDVVEEASERSLDPWLVYAIMREESGFNPRVESWANARGLMQLMEGTAQDMADRVGRSRLRTRDLFRPEVAIELGTEYLRTLANRYDDHPALTIAGYNGGIGNVDRFIRQNGRMPLDQFVEEIPYRQTRDYTKRVLMSMWIYHWLYDESAPVVALDFAVPSLE